MKQSVLAPPPHMISDHPAPSSQAVYCIKYMFVEEHNSLHLPRVEKSVAVLQNLSLGLSFQLLEFSLPTRIA